MNASESAVLQNAANQLKCYGFASEAAAILGMAARGAIGVDIDLGKLGAYAEAGKWTENINFSPDYFSDDFLMITVPFLAHEYAHIAELKGSVIPFVARFSMNAAAGLGLRNPEKAATVVENNIREMGGKAKLKGFKCKCEN